ncbi:MAG: recombination protein RecR [Elusimicrobia bacterium CG06_land_8_20_14_3_00_38_11]|nr:MAG: recombination protein RecR [Elusimicrobia bacterium CG06_land_8_20_14_3_00_38_11]
MIKPLVSLIDAFKKLPGVGQKQAERFAFFIIRSPQNDAENLASSIINTKKSIKTCSICASLCEKSPCEICSDENRDRKKICVVENYTDLQVIEKTGRYKGLYHVLSGVLSPLDGVHQDNLTLKLLMKRLDAVEEILIATNPTVEGDATAMYISQLVKPHNIKITRLAKGIPSGGSIEYSDEITLINALDGRKEI